MVVKHIILFILLFFIFSCKNDAKKIINNGKGIDSLVSLKNNKKDSLLNENKKGEKFLITSAKNKKFLESLILEKINYNSQSDYNNIKSVLLKTPNEIDFTYLHSKTNKNGIIFQNFGLANYLEYKKPYKEYSPFINQKTKQIDFIISYDESTVIPLKISFKKGQYFWFGKSFKWITPKIKIKDTLLDDYQDFNENSFSNGNNQKMIRGGDIFEYNKKKYLLFTFWDGMWCIHHLFEITDDNNIKYYILNSIYTNEDGYGDFNNDNKLDFKQRYFYLRNSIDTTQNKYKIYTIK